MLVVIADRIAVAIIIAIVVSIRRSLFAMPSYQAQPTTSRQGHGCQGTTTHNHQAQSRCTNNARCGGHSHLFAFVVVVVVSIVLKTGTAAAVTPLSSGRRGF